MVSIHSSIHRFIRSTIFLSNRIFARSYDRLCFFKKTHSQKYQGVGRNNSFELEKCIPFWETHLSHSTDEKTEVFRRYLKHDNKPRKQQSGEKPSALTPGSLLWPPPCAALQWAFDLDNISDLWKGPKSIASISQRSKLRHPESNPDRLSSSASPQLLHASRGRHLPIPISHVWMQLIQTQSLYSLWHQHLQTPPWQMPSLRTALTQDPCQTYPHLLRWLFCFAFFNCGSSVVSMLQNINCQQGRKLAAITSGGGISVTTTERGGGKEEGGRKKGKEGEKGIGRAGRWRKERGEGRRENMEQGRKVKGKAGGRKNILLIRTLGLLHFRILRI